MEQAILELQNTMKELARSVGRAGIDKVEVTQRGPQEQDQAQIPPKVEVVVLMSALPPTILVLK
jgi:hypothetical protein